MSDHVYKTIKITGSSKSGIEDAVDKAIAKASKTLKGLSWFEVAGIRGAIEDGATVWQVTVEVGFTLED